MGNAIGMIELSSIAEGVNTADVMVKAANVELIHASTVCPGKYVAIVHGEVGAVRASMKAGLGAAGHYVVDDLLIPNIDPQICPAIMMTTEPGDRGRGRHRILLRRLGDNGGRRRGESG